MANILTLTGTSDGDPSKWPGSTQGYTRNDAYFLTVLGREWAKHQGAAKSVYNSSQLDRLPAGYAGFEKRRGDSKHVDRYTYGHPSGKQFRSVSEFVPHFLGLAEGLGGVSCACCLCKGAGRKRQSGQGFGGANGSSIGGSTTPSVVPGPSAITANPPMTGSAALKRSSSADRVPARVHSQHWAGNYAPATLPLSKKDGTVDDEGTPDIARQLVKRLKSAGNLEERVKEPLSPDWVVGHGTTAQRLKAYRTMPGYVPRVGEIVLFLPKMLPGQSLVFDGKKETWFISGIDGTLTIPMWQAGTVTQLPDEKLNTVDLKQIAPGKKKAVNYHGFRIQLLSDFADLNSKAFVSQYKYVPLHHVRPLSYWQYCLPSSRPDGNALTASHPTIDDNISPTIQNALKAASSFSLLGRYKFLGTWPNADMFYKGVYVGSELFAVGDTVLIQPALLEDDLDVVTDIIKITTIRLKYLNLEDGYADGYQTTPFKHAVHITGHGYTTSPLRSYDGIGKVPVNTATDKNFPQAFAKFGPFYHMCDTSSETRLQVPFSRAIARLIEPEANDAWFTPNNPSNGFNAVNAALPPAASPLTRPLQGIRHARHFATHNDSRILCDYGKSWYWAETRIEALDLQEVNGTRVGAMDKTRTSGQMSKWRNAAIVLNGTDKSATEAAQKMLDWQNKEDEKRKQQAQVMVAGGAGGLVAQGIAVGGLAAPGNDTGNESDEVGSEEDEGSSDGLGGAGSKRGRQSTDVDAAEGTDVKEPVGKKMQLWANLDDDSDDDDGLAADQLVGESIRGGIKGGR